MIAPLVSLLTPVYDTPEPYLRALVDSVISQGAPDWELILVDDASPDPTIGRLLDEMAKRDPRIRVIRRGENGGISRASNDALVAARGPFVGLLDHDDLLLPGALRRVGEVIAGDPDVDVIYTDEDKVDDLGAHVDAFAKPDWSPTRLRAQMYLGHLLVMRAELVRAVGGFRPEFDGSQDHDLALRVTERTDRIHHIPEVLYSWRTHPASTAGSAGTKPYTWDAGVRAVTEHVARIGLDVGVERGRWPNTVELVRRLDPGVLVSVVIPTRGTAGDVEGEPRVFVVEAVRSLLAHTQHSAIEIVVVYDTPTPQEVLDELHEIAGDRLVLEEYTRPFNFSEKCNAGVLASRGEVILLLNDDVEVISDGLIERMAGALAEPDAGLVGANLLYPDHLIQHAGHQYSENGFKHAYFQEREDWSGPFAALTLDRDVSGVTAACVALARATYLEVGGLCEDLPSNFNDVDLCFKIRDAGLRVIWLHDAKLYHFESRTRDTTVEAWEVERVRARWGWRYVDPFVRPEHDERRASFPRYATEPSA
jgi:glycosyltransferase involved in cell wall biosynthesis